MNQFIQADERAFFELTQSLNGHCMRFRNERMPQGCTPQSADIGFEMNQENQRIRVYVQDGIRYTGETASLRRWFQNGFLEFDDVHALVMWFRSDLAPQMSAATDTASAPAPDGRVVGSSGQTPVQTPPQRPDSAITDTARVTEQIRNDGDPVFLDEDDIFRSLSESVIGQSESLRVLATAVSGHVARSNPRRPLTLFAIGPSGVGKTRTGMSIVSVLNSKGRSGRYEFLRLDMCEYRESHRVSQLLGSPQGYVGYGEGAQLTDALARNPRTVVLFDEIEKAHPDILKVLMNAMDAGRLSTAGRAGDGSREVDCRKAVFFFSSNLDSDSILRALEQREGFDDPEAVDEVCRGHLKAAGIPPELIGRIGHFLVYSPLDVESKAEITAMQIRETAAEYGLDVRYVGSDVVVDVIQAVHARGGGARVYAYQIDRLLGRVFREAATQRHTTPIRILGPAPYRYEPMPPGNAPGQPADASNRSQPAPGTSDQHTDQPRRPARPASQPESTVSTAEEREVSSCSNS